MRSKILSLDWKIRSLIFLFFLFFLLLVHESGVLNFEKEYTKYIPVVRSNSFCKRQYNLIKQSNGDFVRLYKEVKGYVKCEYSSRAMNLASNKFEKLCPDLKLQSYSKCVSLFISNRNSPRSSDELAYMIGLIKQAELMDKDKGLDEAQISLIKYESTLKAIQKVKLKKLCFYKKRPKNNSSIAYSKWRNVILAEKADLKIMRTKIIKALLSNMTSANFNRLPAGAAGLNNNSTRVDKVTKQIISLSKML